MRCLLCQHNFEAYEEYGIPPRSGKCPQCGAKPRHRELAWFFDQFVKFEEGSKLLEIGPSKIQARSFTQRIAPAKYTAIDIRHLKHHDLLKPPHRFLEMDATRMSFSDQSFDVILCNHILPFIKSDYQAMSQMHRCLKSSGFAIANVSIELPKTRRAFEMHDENPERYSREFLEENGTEWIYGEDFFERLEAAGFFWHRLRLAPLADSSLVKEQAFRADAELFLCFKFRDTMDAFLANVQEKAKK
jgi:hypothetical protein